MVGQKLLEGQEYVTISLLPNVIKSIRVGLQRVIDDDAVLPAVRDLTTKMLDNFVEHWGSGIDPASTYHLHTVAGARNRRNGLSLKSMLAAALDPRTKFLIAFSAADQALIRNEIRRRLLLVHEEQLQVAPVEGEPIPPVNLQNTKRRRVQLEVQELMDVGLLAEPEVAPVPNLNDGALAIQIVDAEILAFGQQPALSMWSPDGYYSEPLDWWNQHRIKFPLHAVLARRFLGIPATSAPSERVFSAAGLTIANDRARLTPDNANDLIFLRTAGAEIARYEAQHGLIQL